MDKQRRALERRARLGDEGADLQHQRLETRVNDRVYIILKSHWEYDDCWTSPNLDANNQLAVSLEQRAWRDRAKAEAECRRLNIEMLCDAEDYRGGLYAYDSADPMFKDLPEGLQLPVSSQGFGASLSAQQAEELLPYLNLPFYTVKELRIDQWS